MTHTILAPPKASRGGRIAVVSPSWSAPEDFPAVHEQAMSRLREVLGVEPVEYPTTRRTGTPQERARDLMAAFADPGIGAIMATIGGDDQMLLLPHLEPDVVLANPKPYFGYSDNTNVLNWLWRLGLGSFHGGSTQVHLGPGPRVDPVHLTSLKAALFDGGDLEITALREFREDGLPWDDPAALTEWAPPRPAAPWSWHRADRVVSAPTWGGCLEVVHANLAASRWILDNDAYAGCVLLVETSEERPSAELVHRMLRDMGERGLLRRFAAVVVARARASDPEPRSDPALRGPGEQARRRYREDQREAVLGVLERYHPGVMAVFGVDFGHTDPQWVLPYGGFLTVDGPARRITAHYGPG